MDIASLIGLAGGSLLFLVAVLMGSAPLGAFIDIPSLGITLGGMVMALFITYPMKRVLGAHAIGMKVMFGDTPDFGSLYKSIVELATIARRDGILALEEKIGELENAFLKKGLQMMVDGNPPEVISAILTKDIDNMEDRHLTGNGFLKNMGGYCPAFGMVGTLIGLIQMLQDLSDPSALGQGMAVALLTTLYGAFFANLFFIPMGNKLAERSAEELLLNRMLLDGVLAIHAGDSPRIVGDKLLVYIEPAIRVTLMDEG